MEGNQQDLFRDLVKTLVVDLTEFSIFFQVK